MLFIKSQHNLNDHIESQQHPGSFFGLSPINQNKICDKLHWVCLSSIFVLLFCFNSRKFGTWFCWSDDQKKKQKSQRMYTKPPLKNQNFKIVLFFFHENQERTRQTTKYDTTTSRKPFFNSQNAVFFAFQLN